MLNIPKQQLHHWAQATDLKGRGALAGRRQRCAMLTRMLKGEIDVMGVTGQGLLAVRSVPKHVQARRKRRRAQRHARRMTRLHA